MDYTVSGDDIGDCHSHGCVQHYLVVLNCHRNLLALQAGIGGISVQAGNVGSHGFGCHYVVHQQVDEFGFVLWHEQCSKCFGRQRSKCRIRRCEQSHGAGSFEGFNQAGSFHCFYERCEVAGVNCGVDDVHACRSFVPCFGGRRWFGCMAGFGSGRFCAIFGSGGLGGKHFGQLRAQRHGLCLQSGVHVFRIAGRRFGGYSRRSVGFWCCRRRRTGAKAPGQNERQSHKYCRAMCANAFKIGRHSSFPHGCLANLFMRAGRFVRLTLRVPCQQGYAAKFSPMRT